MGTTLTVRTDGRRFLTSFALVVVVLLSTDVVFAVQSVPAVHGITGDPYRAANRRAVPGGTDATSSPDRAAQEAERP